jgi:hypothetical protein
MLAIEIVELFPSKVLRSSGLGGETLVHTRVQDEVSSNGVRTVPVPHERPVGTAVEHTVPLHGPKTRSRSGHKATHAWTTLPSASQRSIG